MVFLLSGQTYPKKRAFAICDKSSFTITFLFFEYTNDDFYKPAYKLRKLNRIEFHL